MNTLSVIIPTFNRAKFLPACVASVRACGVPAEIIVVDDGSTDDTAQTVASLPEVVYVRQENAGVSTARNVGAAHARGECLAFLDSDDTWRTGTAVRLVETLRRYPEIDVVFGDALFGNPQEGFHSSLMAELGGEEFRRLPDRRPEHGMRLFEATSFFRRLIQRNQVFLGSTIMRRSAFEATGGFDPELFGAEDYELTLRLARRGSFAYIDEPLACYLRHPDSISANVDLMERDFAMAMKKMLEKCPDLSSSERAQIRRRERVLLYYQGYNSFNRGELAEARRRLRLLFREVGPDPASLALWMVCCLPTRWVRGLRQIKKRLTRAA